jgi:hypothetical protein
MQQSEVSSQATIKSLPLEVLEVDDFVKHGDCLLLSAALRDLKVLGLDMDVVAKRQLFGLRSVRREFPDRVVTFQPDGTFTIHAEAVAK